MDPGADPLDFLGAYLDEVRVVRGQPLFERPWQRTGDLGREVAGLHEVPLKERDHARMASGIDVAGRQQRAGGAEGRVVVTVDGTTVRMLFGEKVSFPAGSRRAFNSVLRENVRFRTHKATPSRVTV